MQQSQFSFDEIPPKKEVKKREKKAAPTPPPEPVQEEEAVLTVSQLNREMKSTLEGKFPLIWVKGEISNFKAHSSGHFYFSLKDPKSQINAIMFRGYNSKLKFRPADGLEVVVRGRITVYEPRGNYQIACELMEPVGAGALQKAFEQLKEKLKAEGLFEASRKRPLPLFPKHIAVVTSPTGAAIRDILNVLSRRYRGAQVTVIPAVVQGEQAAPAILRGIQSAQEISDVDVLIVGRGGGSMEDLWCFNDEKVARAIVASRIPVISAVGHEVDFTIADFVADLRAPTPSAAAELVVKNAAELNERVSRYLSFMNSWMRRELKAKTERVVALRRQLVDPKRYLEDLSQRCDDLIQRLNLSIGRYLTKRRSEISLLSQKLGTPTERIQRERKSVEIMDLQLKASLKENLKGQRSRLEQMMSVLESLSPLKVVDRGYAIVTHGKKLIKDAGKIKKDDKLLIQFAKGKAEVQVCKTEGAENGL